MSRAKRRRTAMAASCLLAVSIITVGDESVTPGYGDVRHFEMPGLAAAERNAARVAAPGEIEGATELIGQFGKRHWRAAWLHTDGALLAAAAGDSEVALDTPRPTIPLSLPNFDTLLARPQLNQSINDTRGTTLAADAQVAAGPETPVSTRGDNRGDGRIRDEATESPPRGARDDVAHGDEDAGRILVTSQQDLDSTLAAATGGETIALLSGDYEAIRLKIRNFDADVRIVSADPDALATITGEIHISGVSNLSIEGVDVLGDAPLAAHGARIAIQSSSNVRIAHMKLTGAVPDSSIDPNDPSLSPIEALRGMPHEYGVKITGSTGVTLDALDITTMYKGVIVDKSADIAITNSEFHDLRSDGVNFVDTSDLRIEGNYFHDFTPWLNQGNGTGDHPDFIQYWGAPGGAGIDGVVIRDNIMLQGVGDFVQSIFGHFGPRGADSDPFTNFEVSGNFIQTNHVHGIALGDVSGGQIFGNVLIPSGMDIASPGDGGWRPSIHLTSLGDAGASDIEIFDNVITLSWRPVFDPTGQGVEANVGNGIVYWNNAVLDRGKAVPAYWAELQLPDPADFADAATWIEAARIQIGAEETPESAPPATRDLKL